MDVRGGRDIGDERGKDRGTGVVQSRSRATNASPAPTLLVVRTTGRSSRGVGNRNRGRKDKGCPSKTLWFTTKRIL